MIPAVEIEPAMTMEELKAATGWSKPTIHAAIHQGVIPGRAFRVGDSSKWTYVVPRPAFLRWLADPSSFTPAPAPKPLIRSVARSA